MLPFCSKYEIVKYMEVQLRGFQEPGSEELKELCDKTTNKHKYTIEIEIYINCFDCKENDDRVIE